MGATDRDTGLGTTYERLALAAMLERLKERYHVESVLEGPTDGITGIRGLNSVPLALAGASVELVLSDPDELALAERVWNSLGLADRIATRLSNDFRLAARARSFDLVWNFNSLPQVPDPEGLVREMCEASRNLVLVLTSNTWNYGFPLHRLHHRVAGEEWTHGDLSAMRTNRIARILTAQGFEVVGRPLVDTPWWPDIDSPIEEVAATFLPFLRKAAASSRRLDRYTWAADELPYFDTAKREKLMKRLARHFVIERARRFPLKIFFAHHRGVLARRKETA